MTNIEKQALLEDRIDRSVIKAIDAGESPIQIQTKIDWEIAQFEYFGAGEDMTIGLLSLTGAVARAVAKRKAGLI